MKVDDPTPTERLIAERLTVLAADIAAVYGRPWYLPPSWWLRRVHRRLIEALVGHG